MAKTKLTDGQVEALRGGEQDGYIWDTALPRFGVRVTPAGTKLYLVQYRAKAAPGEKSKTRRITIGVHDGDLWNVTKARAQARRLLGRVDNGSDPFGEDRSQRQSDHQAEIAQKRDTERKAQETFTALAELFIKRKAKTNRSWAETERLLRFGLDAPKPGKRRSGHRTGSDAAPGPMKAWGSRHISEIRRADVAELVERIAERSPAVARSTYAALRPLFDWCVQRDLIEYSPCEKLTAPPRPKARDRVMSDAELRVVWLASERLGYPFGPVVQLLMLTGQRRAEVAGMTWAEIDLAEARWRIPAERTKNGQAHEIDLSPQAVAIIEKVANTGPQLFAARGGGAVRGFSATKRRLDELAAEVTAELAADGEEIAAPLPWRLHDLRRTAATGMAALAFPPHIVERVLNHVSGTQGGLVGVYQRHEYRAERKAAITAWGVHVDAVVKGEAPPSNVIPMRA